MSLVGFRGQNHPQQVGKRGLRPEVDDRATPPEVFDPLHERFRFTIDVAASPENAKLPRYYTIEDDGLAQSWANESVWCNPPYSHPNLGLWTAKALREWNRGAERIVMLVPANRTEQEWWQRYVEPCRDGNGGPRVEFLMNRSRFIRPGSDSVGPNERPPFGCCLLIWGQS